MFVRRKVELHFVHYVNLRLMANNGDFVWNFLIKLIITFFLRNVFYHIPNLTTTKNLSVTTVLQSVKPGYIHL